MELQWIKCPGDEWCPLDIVNLDDPFFDNLEGVYIIWHGGDPASTIIVGQGNIREKLTAHRNDSRIYTYNLLGVFVTWASVPEAYRDGIEVYLAQKLNPELGERLPNLTPIEVNLPW